MAAVNRNKQMSLSEVMTSEFSSTVTFVTDTPSWSCREMRILKKTCTRDRDEKKEGESESERVRENLWENQNGKVRNQRRKMKVAFYSKTRNCRDREPRGSRHLLVTRSRSADLVDSSNFSALLKLLIFPRLLLLAPVGVWKARWK